MDIVTGSPLWSLQGVRAVITGSTKGIGLETTKEFLNLGASVVVSNRMTFCLRSATSFRNTLSCFCCSL